MSENATQPADELLSRAVAAARVGERDEARRLLEELTQLEPDSAEAWLWLADVSTSPEEKRRHFERVLQLDPESRDAAAGLERLAQKYGAAVLAPEDELTALRCAWHPQRETLLRCHRCARPMCPSCAVQHPVGMRCRECAHELRSPLYRVSPGGYVAAAMVGLTVSSLAGTLAIMVAQMVGLMGLLLAVFAGAAVGAGVAEAMSRASGGKRGRGLQILAAASMVVGTAWAAVALSVIWSGGLIPNPTVLLYVVFGAGAASASLR
jgi:tetratricopeptide (TPR) repeat protein